MQIILRTIVSLLCYIVFLESAVLGQRILPDYGP